METDVEKWGGVREKTDDDDDKRRGKARDAACVRSIACPISPLCGKAPLLFSLSP